MTTDTPLLVTILVLGLPALVAGGGLRGLLLEPLQMPPPATADMALSQMNSQAPAPAPAGGPAGGPGPAPGPAPGGMPEEPKIPKITEAQCKKLTAKVGALVGMPGAAGPSPAPASALLQDVAGGAPAPAKPHAIVECKIYAFVSGKGEGCTCFLESPPAPFKPKVAGCPTVPNAIELGFTGGVVDLGSMAFGGQTGGWSRHTCVYRQWFFDPQAAGKLAVYQSKLNDARTEKYIKDTYKASLNNAHNTAAGFWALTPVPWGKLYPDHMTMPPREAMNPAPAPGPAPGPSTTPPILFDYPTTTPSPFATTPASPFGTTPAAFGAPTTAAAFGAVTPPVYTVAR